MKYSFILLAITMLSLSTAISSCSKKKACGYCQYEIANSQGIYTQTNGPTVCDDDGGVAAALSNAQQACAAANQGSGGNTTKWISQ